MSARPIPTPVKLSAPAGAVCSVREAEIRRRPRLHGAWLVMAPIVLADAMAVLSGAVLAGIPVTGVSTLHLWSQAAVATAIAVACLGERGGNTPDGFFTPPRNGAVCFGPPPWLVSHSPPGSTHPATPARSSSLSAPGV